MLALRAARLFDGLGEASRGPVTVLIQDGRIAEVLDGHAAPDGAEVTDLGDVTLLPGLIDAHVHLVFDGMPEPWLRLEGTGTEAVLDIAHASAQRQLAAGVTTVRDLGDKDFVTLRLRDRYASGELLGPTVVCSGPPITAPGGHCHFLGGELDLAAPADTVRAWAGRGVDVIKLMVSGGEITPGSTPFHPQLDDAAVRQVVDAAHALGLPVTAHAHDPVSVGRALDAGVDGLEHCTFWVEDGVAENPALHARIAASGVAVCPTPGQLPGAAPPPRVAARMEATREHFVKLHATGARLVAGSDAGIAPPKPHGVLPYAIATMAVFGMPPWRALRSATADAAEALGLAGVKGVVAPGADADLLAVRGNPLEDLAALLEPVAVLTRGRFAVRPGG